MTFLFVSSLIKGFMISNLRLISGSLILMPSLVDRRTFRSEGSNVPPRPPEKD